MIRFRHTVTSKRFFKALLAQSVAPAVLMTALCAAPAAYAQQTTSSIAGLITNADGTPAAGTRVVITHQPSGTTANAVVDATGRFNAGGLRVGGPYVVKIEPAGGQPEAVNDIYLQLGQPFALSLTLKPQAPIADAQEIVVSGDREQVKLAAQSVFRNDAIDSTPTVSRDLKDIIKQDPRVLIDPTNSNSIQIAGTSPRFNSITLDGVAINDDFGLNNNGYPTQHGPVPLDAIDQLAVVIAPFDVDYDGFQGGNVNIVTKSGTNDFHGSAYYYYSDQHLSGQRSGSRDNLIPDFQTKTRGGTLGGPIIPDKLFFFGSYEDFQTLSPAIYGTNDGNAGTRVPGITSADVANVSAIAKRVYGYDTGTVVSSTPEHDRTAIGKFDWNINDNHRATFTFEHSETNQLIDGSSSSSGALFTASSAVGSITSAPRLSLSSDFYQRGQTMNNYVLQEFSDWTPDFSTQVELGRKTVDSTRVPLGGYSIGQINVTAPGGGQVVFGPDLSSQSNVLDTTTDTYKIKAKYTLDDHTISGGYERTYNDYFNLFVQRSLGVFYFANETAFANGASSYFRYGNAPSNNANDAAANFNYAENSGYIQDRWEVTDDLTLQAGLRYEIYQNGPTPALDPNFVTRNGFANNANIDGKEIVLPRIGFNWKIEPGTSLHGGFGQFSTLGPAVWLSNDYSNTGFTIANITSQTAGAAIQQTSTLTVPSAAQAALKLPSAEGTVNSLDPHFNIPSSYRTDIAIDHTFEDGLSLTGDFLYTKVANGILYRDLRMKQTGVAPDGRPLYTSSSTSVQDLYLTNTHGGESEVVSLGVNKEWKTEIGTFLINSGYAFTRATDVNPGTSSVAASTYGDLAVSDPNHPGVANSNYAAAHTFSAAATWTEKFFGDNKSSVTLLGIFRSGLPYSYTYACGANPFGDSACSASGIGRELLYVPTGANDPKVNWAASSVTPAQFDAYINQFGLSKYRGTIAPRNAFNAPWFNSFDLHLLQELPTPFEGHKVQLTLDTVNFSNLLFPSWGRMEQISFPGDVLVTTPKIVNNQYVFTSPLVSPNQQVQSRPSVWQIQMGLHYSF